MPILTAVAGVLIETYWNVKLFFTGNRWYLYNRINRNILECKVEATYDMLAKRIVLIETYWNVKFTTWPET